MNLSAEETQLFYKLRFALLGYVNCHLNLIPEVTTAAQIREHAAELRDALLAHPDLLERFVAENPQGFSAQELAIVARWRHHVTGDFYIMRHLKPYSVFMGTREEVHLYGVLGLTTPIDAVIGGAPLPVMVKATLLPFGNRIIYDGIMELYRVVFGKGIRTGLNREYKRLKDREGIIEQLVGPSGEPQVRTSLDRKAPRKPAPDWRPVVDGIIAQAEKMRQTDTPLQAAAFGLLRAAASLAQATLQERDAEAQAVRRLRSVHAALTKVENILYEE